MGPRLSLLTQPAYSYSNSEPFPHVGMLMWLADIAGVKNFVTAFYCNASLSVTLPLSDLFQGASAERVGKHKSNFV